MRCSFPSGMRKETHLAQAPERIRNAAKQGMREN